MKMSVENSVKELDTDERTGAFEYPDNFGPGVSEKTVRRISKIKNEDRWLRGFRLNAWHAFRKKRFPMHWAPRELSELKLDEHRYYIRPQDVSKSSRQSLAETIRKTLSFLKVPEEEQGLLGGVKVQLNNEIVYSSMREHLRKRGIIFVDSSEGLMRYPHIFRRWFGKLVPVNDNIISALNSAVFSGGCFIYIPPGLKVEMPLKGFFHINEEHCGQCGRTLIIADEDSEITFLEGCTSATSPESSLHASVGEMVALPGAKIQYVSIQNFASNVFNLVNLRGLAFEGSEIRWIDGNMGGRLTMKYPNIVLKGRKAHGEMLSISLANDGQHQDTGAKMNHLADETSSNTVSKSISIGRGRSSFRGFVNMSENACQCRNNTECDALLVNAQSGADTYPAITIRGDRNSVQHEASVSKISAEKIFYMQQRGLSEADATSLCVNGFVNDLVNAFPIEYSVQLKRLIDLEMEGSVG